MLSDKLNRIPIPLKYRGVSCPLFITWEKEGATEKDVFIRGKRGSMR